VKTNIEQISNDAQKQAQSNSGDIFKNGRGGNLGISKFVKVDASRLESLGQAIDKIISSTSVLEKCCKELQDDNEAILKIAKEIALYSGKLQDLKISMQRSSIKGLFQKMSRIVHDASKKLGKNIEVHTSGEDIELDRTLIENLSDSILHIVRNAVDHGIETPIERQRKGKQIMGRLELSLTCFDNIACISVSDDGRGLDTELLYLQGVKQGFIQPSSKLASSEIYNLIFQQGFSTASSVTDFSGRGVGMDIVKASVEEMGGKIEIESAPGEGTKIIIKLAL
jgi:two-component system, chemotaxis family, sensor kinase CheA